MKMLFYGHDKSMLSRMAAQGYLLQEKSVSPVVHKKVMR